MTNKENQAALEIAQIAAKMAIAKASRDAIKTLNTAQSDFPPAKRTFTYKKAGQL